MTEIKPKMVNGEPVCSEECPSRVEKDDPLGFDEVWCAHKNEVNLGYAILGQVCVPALRQQRDEALARLEAVERELEQAKTKLETHIPEEVIKNLGYMGVRIAKREEGGYLGFNDRADNLYKELEETKKVLSDIRVRIDEKLGLPPAGGKRCNR